MLLGTYYANYAAIPYLYWPVPFCECFNAGIYVVNYIGIQYALECKSFPVKYFAINY